MAFDDLKNFSAPIVPPTLGQYRIQSVTLNATVPMAIVTGVAVNNGTTVSFSVTVQNGQCVANFNDARIPAIVQERPTAFNQFLTNAMLNKASPDALRDGIASTLTAAGLLP